MSALDPTLESAALPADFFLPIRTTEKLRPAVLVLADGTIYRGASFGAQCIQTGEICFNTSMTGYQEILTDPSYAGQVVVMTCPQIGNVGTTPDDDESGTTALSGFVVKELSPSTSNWRSQTSLHEYLAERGIPGISGLDTRSLVRRIRNDGFQMAALSTDPTCQDPETLKSVAVKAPNMDGRDLVASVTCKRPYRWTEGTWQGIVGQLPRCKIPAPELRVVVYDFGVKRNILRLLVDHGFGVTVVPATTTADAALKLDPDAIFLSNGPGDPAGVRGVPEQVRRLCDEVPIFGICLGHQILGLALGGTTRKLKFGHHGANQPNQDIASGKIAICAENHGYAVDADSLQAAGEAVEITHVNLNDGTAEGLAHRDRPIFSMQYHPEASPGPHDAVGYFQRFREMVLCYRSGERVSGIDVLCATPTRSPSPVRPFPDSRR